jgi:hypothetical protein
VAFITAILPSSWRPKLTPDSRVHEHLKCGGYSRRCQRGSSETGPHRVRAIFPGPHLSVPALEALPAQPGKRLAWHRARNAPGTHHGTGVWSSRGPHHPTCRTMHLRHASYGCPCHGDAGPSWDETQTGRDGTQTGRDGTGRHS